MNAIVKPRCCTVAVLNGFFGGMRDRERPWWPALRAMPLADAVHSVLLGMQSGAPPTADEAKTIAFLEGAHASIAHHEMTWADLDFVSGCGHPAAWDLGDEE